MGKFAQATLFMDYALVYDRSTGSTAPLCGRGPPPELVEAAGGEAAVASICGFQLRATLATELFEGTQSCLVLVRAPALQVLTFAGPIYWRSAALWLQTACTSCMQT